MAEKREIKDPFTGQVVQINNDLVRRLRGEYASGPTMPNGEPEFGWRKFGEPSPINLEAANKIERLRAAIKAECHRLEHDYNAADVTEARRALMAAAAS